MLVDANMLLFAVDRNSFFHKTAATWLAGILNGPTRVGLPWAVLNAFVRIVTNPRASKQPLNPEAAWGHVEDWLGCDTVWTPNPTDRHAETFKSLVVSYQLRGNLISGAHLAALAIDHGLEVCSADADFARFREIRWTNPLQCD
jgi:toxin-antitoxin system PIN domain toxin